MAEASAKDLAETLHSGTDGATELQFLVFELPATRFQPLTSYFLPPTSYLAHRSFSEGGPQHFRTSHTEALAKVDYLLNLAA